MEPARQRELRESVAANVEAARRRRGWTQAELAERAEIDEMTLKGVELAKYTAKLTTFVSLARALGVTADELLKPKRFARAKRGRPRLKGKDPNLPRLL